MEHYGRNHIYGYIVFKKPVIHRGQQLLKIVEIVSALGKIRIIKQYSGKGQVEDTEQPGKKHKLLADIEFSSKLRRSLLQEEVIPYKMGKSLDILHIYGEIFIITGNKGIADSIYYCRKSH